MDKDYIRIYVHETEGVDEARHGDGIVPHTWYEYDFKEIVVPTDTLDIDDVKADPESYLDYEPVAPTTLGDLEEALLALQQIVLGGES